MSSSIALIAHDSRKNEIVVLAKKYYSILARYDLIATSATGQKIEQEAGLSVNKVKSSSEGGILQIAAQIVTGEVVGVIFLMDGLNSQFPQPDCQALIRICNFYDTPLATNISTAELSIQAVAKLRDAYLIFNPVAGQGNPDRDLEMIRRILEPQMNLHTIFTQPGLDPAIQAKEAIAKIQANQTEEQIGCVIASGGDGTVSAVAGATIETGIPLGVIPRGTANAFSVALGLPTKLKLACETIAAGNTKMVDAAYCNKIPMILLAGVGFEAEMVNNANRELKNRLGTLAYVLSGAQQFFTQQDFQAQIEIENQVLDFKTGAVTVANAAPATSIMAQGFGAVIPHDGLLEVTIPVSKTWLEGINTSASLLASALAKSKVEDQNLIRLRTNKLKLTTEPTQKLVVDGEVFDENPVEFICMPNGLTIFSQLSSVESVPSP